MAESNSKRQKAAEEEDRISSLPDCMLSHILSFLPTKTSVETSVLARRWRYIWKDISVLDFSDDFLECLFATYVREFANRCLFASLGACLYENPPCYHCLNITQIRFSDGCNLQNVVRASLDVFPSSSDHSLGFTCLLELLNALSGIRHLELGCSTTKWLLGGPADLHFPKFSHLLHLELILPWFNSNFLLSLLQTCHLLQVLIIQNDKEESPLPGWAIQPSGPNCIVSQLTFIQFKGFQGLLDELFFVEYILRKGIVLKTMIIDDISVDLSKKYNILNKIPKVLKDAIFQLIFD